MGWLWGTVGFVVLLIIFGGVKLSENSSIAERNNNYYHKLCQKTNAKLEIELMNKIWFHNGHDFDKAFRQTQEEMRKRGFDPCVPYSFYYQGVYADYAFKIFVHEIDWKDKIDLPFRISNYNGLLGVRVDGKMDSESVARLHQWCMERKDKYPYPEEGAIILGRYDERARRFESEVVSWRKDEYENVYPQNYQTKDPIPTVDEFVYNVRPWPDMHIFHQVRPFISVWEEIAIRKINLMLPKNGSTAVFPEHCPNECKILSRKLGYSSVLHVMDCTTGKVFDIEFYNGKIRVEHPNRWW